MRNEDAHDALRLLLFENAAAAASLIARQNDCGSELARLGRANAITLRLHHALELAGIAVPAEFERAAQAERVRVNAVWTEIEKIDQVCRCKGVAVVFPKADQHSPDMGHDIDVLVDDPSKRIDRDISAALEAREGGSSLFNRIARKTAFTSNEGGSPIEIHHARLGLVGEQALLAKSILSHGRPRNARPHVKIPDLHDRLLVQATQRVLGHRTLRIGDVLSGVSILRAAPEPVELWRRASILGLGFTVETYLRGLLGIVGGDMGRALLAPRQTVKGPLSLTLLGGMYLFPAASVARAYASVFGRAGLRGDVVTVARIAAIPFAAGLTLVGRASSSCS